MTPVKCRRAGAGKTANQRTGRGFFSVRQSLYRRADVAPLISVSARRCTGGAV
ncbi:hypothetical protein KCP69_11500 [Salmonella enterica subsp. enterica]|nr:hypothetical protein KCP69_11500 [Salmonella enterica subsp. enterica]